MAHENRSGARVSRQYMKTSPASAKIRLCPTPRKAPWNTLSNCRNAIRPWRVMPMLPDLNQYGDVSGAGSWPRSTWLVPFCHKAGPAAGGHGFGKFLCSSSRFPWATSSASTPISCVGKTSITVSAEVYAQRNYANPIAVKVTEAQLTYVAIDLDRQKNATFRQKLRRIRGLRTPLHVAWGIPRTQQTCASCQPACWPPFPAPPPPPASNFGRTPAVSPIPPCWIGGGGPTTPAPFTTTRPVWRFCPA